MVMTGDDGGSSVKVGLARSERFELPALGFEGRRSSVVYPLSFIALTGALVLVWDFFWDSTLSIPARRSFIVVSV